MKRGDRTLLLEQMKEQKLITDGSVLMQRAEMNAVGKFSVYCVFCDETLTAKAPLSNLRRIFDEHKQGQRHLKRTQSFRMCVNFMSFTYHMFCYSLQMFIRGLLKK